MLPVLLLVALAAIVGIVVGMLRRRRPEPVAAPAPKVLAAAVAPAPRISGTVAPPRAAVIDPLEALDALLAELESTTVRIDGADELDERAVAELEGLAARLEAAAATFATR